MMRAPGIYGREQLGAQGKGGGVAPVESEAGGGVRRGYAWKEEEGD